MPGSDLERQGAAALADLFETHYERVARYIAVRIGDQDHAEELAADVFARALKRIDTFRWHGIPMQAWLFRIAHNVAMDYLRRASRRKTTPLEEAGSIAAGDHPEREALQTLQREELLEAMDSTTPAQREVLSLRFFGGLTSGATVPAPSARVWAFSMRGTMASLISKSLTRMKSSSRSQRMRWVNS